MKKVIVFGVFSAAVAIIYIACSLLSSVFAINDVSIPYSFSPGTIARSDRVNSNFNAIRDSLNKLFDTLDTKFLRYNGTVLNVDSIYASSGIKSADDITSDSTISGYDIICNGSFYSVGTIDCSNNIYADNIYSNGTIGSPSITIDNTVTTDSIYSSNGITSGSVVTCVDVYATDNINCDFMRADDSIQTELIYADTAVITKRLFGMDGGTMWGDYTFTDSLIVSGNTKIIDTISILSTSDFSYGKNMITIGADSGSLFSRTNETVKRGDVVLYPYYNDSMKIGVMSAYSLSNTGTSTGYIYFGGDEMHRSDIRPPYGMSFKVSDPFYVEDVFMKIEPAWVTIQSPSALITDTVLVVGGLVRIDGNVIVDHKLNSDSIGVGLGNLGVPTSRLDVDGNSIRVRQPKTPATSTSDGDSGTICWDASYMYICVSPNSWKRITLETF